jgi:hypothetical protein
MSKPLTTIAKPEASFLAVFCPECNHKLVLRQPSVNPLAPLNPRWRSEDRSCSCGALWHIVARTTPVEGQEPVFHVDFAPLDPSTLRPR